MRVAKALKQKCKKGDTFYLLKRVLSQVWGINLLVIPFVADHHRRQARIRAWKQQFQAKSIHAIEIVSIQPLCSDKPQASIQSKGTLICNFGFKCHLVASRMLDTTAFHEVLGRMFLWKVHVKQELSPTVFPISPLKRLQRKSTINVDIKNRSHYNLSHLSFRVNEKNSYLLTARFHHYLNRSSNQFSCCITRNRDPISLLLLYKSRNSIYSLIFKQTERKNKQQPFQEQSTCPISDDQ